MKITKTLTLSASVRLSAGLVCVLCFVTLPYIVEQIEVK